MDYTPSDKDWKHVIDVMTKYNRQSGFIDVIEDNNGKPKLEFFDSDPKLNNVGAVFVTLEDVKRFSQ
jgi:hypothetical protein